MCSQITTEWLKNEQYRMIPEVAVGWLEAVVTAGPPNENPPPVPDPVPKENPDIVVVTRLLNADVL